MEQQIWEENKNIEAAKRIRELWEDVKKTHGVTYDQLAKITGVSRNTLASWISLKRCPPDYVVNLIEIKLKEFKEKNPSLKTYDDTWRKK